MKQSLTIVGLACLASSPALANQLSIDLNRDTFHAQVDATHASNGILYAGELFLTADNGDVAAISMRTAGQVGNNVNLTGGLGGKIYAMDHTETDAALSIGGHLEYTIPELKDFSFSGGLYYAPGIIATGDIESLVDFNLRVTYKLFENASVFGGVRHLEAKYDFDAEHEFDSGPHAGIQIEF